MSQRFHAHDAARQNPVLPADEQSSGPLQDIYRITFEQAAMGIMNARLDGSIFEVNATLCAMIGYTREELLTMRVQDLTPAEEWTKDLDSYRALRVGQINALSLENRYLKKDGSLIWVQLSISILRNTVGEALYYIGILQDITAKKSSELSVQSEYASLESEAYKRALDIRQINEELQAERRQRQRSEEEMALFFNTTLDMLCIGNYDGYFTKLSPSWTKVLGWSLEELYQNPFFNYIHPDDLEMTKAALDRLLQGDDDIPLVNRLICKDGSTKWIEWRSHAFPQRQIIIGAARDITDKKATEAILQEAKHQLEEANWNLLERNDELQSLYSISQSLFEDLDFTQRLEHLQDALIQRFNADALFIHTYDEHTGYLMLESEVGSSPELRQLSSRLKPNEGLAALAIQRKEVLMTTADQHPDPKLSAAIQAMGIQRLASIPLIAGSTVIGSITLLYRDKKTFSAQEKRLYQTIGSQLAVALNNSKLYSEVQEELSQRRRLEVLQTETLKDLEKERAFVTHMMEIIPISIVIIDKDGIITFANAASECTLDAPVNGLENHTYLNPNWQYFRLDGTPLPFSEQPFECIQSTKKPLFDHIQVIIDTKGDRRVLSFNGTPLLDPQGDLEWAIFSIQDITNRVQYEEDLKASRDAAEEANKAKSEFLANMSHEIRTPLNAVIGFSEILKKSDLPQVLSSHVDAINIAGKSLLTLINDILDLSKIESGVIEVKLNPLSPARLLSEIEQIFRQGVSAKGLALNVSIAPDVPKWLLLDELRLRQVLLNLVGNAVKFTHRGSIEIDLAITDVSTLSPTKETCSLTLTVKDTGIGIAEQDFGRIFESFRQQSGQTTRTYEGTGLGLTISRKLVEMMGGTIRVESTLGTGSAFIVTLPEVERIFGDEQPPLPQDYTAADFTGNTVLIVDDVELNLALTREVLEALGIRVLKAYNGEQAIMEAIAEKPDLILMDIRMPILDGIEATKRIKADAGTRHIPIVALTASVTEWSQDEIHSMGFDGFLLKPLVTQRLYQLLETFLRPHRPKSTARSEHSTGSMPQASKTLPLDVPMAAEALLELHRSLDPVVSKLKGAIKLSTVKLLADLLLSAAEAYHSPSLQDIGNRLKEQITLWDIEGIRSTIIEVQSFLAEISMEETANDSQ